MKFAFSLIVSMLVFVVMSGSVSAQYIDCNDAINNGVDMGGRTCQELTSCGVLDQVNIYYLLTNDITDDNTCLFVVGAGDRNMVIDLNGHTVYFAANGATVSCQSYNGWVTGDVCHYGIVMARRIDYIPDMPPEWEWSTAGGVEIKNGAVIQATNRTSFLDAIYPAGNWKIHDVMIYVKGADSTGINNVYTNNAEIYNNFLNSSSTYITNRHQGRRAIYVGSNNQIYNNTIRNFPQQGINAGDNNLIYNNDIRNKMTYTTNPIAIAVNSNNIIYNNHIEPISGRGIYMEANNLVYNNYIDVKEGPSPETWHTHGIRLRNGDMNNSIFNNTIIARGGYDNYGDAYAIRISEAPNVNNKIYNNVIMAITNSSSFDAYAFYIDGGGSNSGYANDYIFNNTIISNHKNVIFAAWAGSANDFLFISNKFVKAENPINYHTFLLLHQLPLPSIQH